MRKSINIHLAIGEFIMSEKILVILTVITKGSWNAIIMAGMKQKNMIRKDSKTSIEKPKNDGRKTVRITNLLRK
jgi:hypothetical protein